MFSFKFAFSSLCLASVLALAADPTVVIKKTAVVPTSPASGPEMFKQYCASCHGVDAKGHGPAVPALKVPPPDLTMLAKNNKGKYPAFRVQTAIQGDTALTAHGNKDMPIWGTLFREMSSSNDSRVAARISNLSSYIETLQQK